MTGKAFTPLPQQQIMIDFVLSHPVAMLGVAMGLGKTASVLSAISALISNGQSRGVLIVAPLRVVNMTWPAEREEWSDFHWLRMVSLRTEAGVKAWKEGTADVYLINYEQLQQFSDWGLKGRKKLPADMVVWDEITFAKNPTSKRIRSFRPFRSMFSRHVGLTGTLASQGYMDLWGPYRLLDGGERLGLNITDYRSRYFTPDYLGYTYTLKDWAAEVIQKKIEDITLILSSEDWLKLDPAIQFETSIMLTPPLRKQYCELEKELLLTVKDREIMAPNSAALVTKLLQFTSGAIYDSEKKVVAIHDLKIESLKQIITEVKAPILLALAYEHERSRILAEIPGAEEFDEKNLARWNAGKIPVWVLHPKSGGHGLNLQHGGAVTVWFSQTYSKEFNDQVNARTRRTGQKKPTSVYRILVQDTIDEAILETLEYRGKEQAGLMHALKALKRLRESNK